MENIKISTKDGRIFYSKALLLGLRTLESAKDTVVTTFPMNVDIVRCNGTKDGMELTSGTLVIDAEFSPYLKKEYLKTYEDFSTGKKIVFNRNTKEITTFEGFNLELVLSTEKLLIPEYLDEVMEFMIYVMMYRNPYIYNLFTEYTPKSKKFLRHLYPFSITKLVQNIFKHLDDLDNLEKVAKTIGEDFILDNICRDFELNNDGKKLHQVVDIPLVVANGIKKLKIEKSYNDFKAISSVDKSYAVFLIEYLLAFKKIVANKLCNETMMLRYIKNISILMETGLFNDCFSALINYLINENFNYSKFNLPYDESRELCDYITMVLKMKEVDVSVQFEKLPKNIRKAHNVMVKNSQILSIPRPEEFASAVEKYSFVNDDTDKDYVFMVPKDELELLNEGNMLHHCVSAYRDRVIDFGCKVVLMRKKGEEDIPFVTIEYEDGDVLQIKEKYNEDVTDLVVLDAVDRWAIRSHRREKKWKVS